MTDKPSRLYYKTVQDIFYPYSDKAGVKDLDLTARVLSVIQEYLEKTTGISVDPQRLRVFGRYQSSDERHTVNIASIQPDNSQLLSFQWAVRINSYDSEYPRRRLWRTNIGIEQKYEDHLRLYFTQYLLDDVGGLLQPIPAPKKKAPLFIHMLLNNSSFSCGSGKYLVPNQPEQMYAEDTEILLDVLFDPNRTMPVIIITCPVIINPTGLYSRLAGNAMVYYTEDPGIIMELNQHLPYHLRIDYDAIRIINPIQESAPVEHPSFRVNAADSKSAVEIISRAYSESFMRQEWREFVTYDSIKDVRNKLSCTEMQEENTRLKKEYEKAQKKIEQLSSSCEKLKIQIDGTVDASTCEEMLEEALNELDQIIREIEASTALFYGNIGNLHFAPAGSTVPALREFEQAVLTFMSSIRYKSS